MKKFVATVAAVLSLSGAGASQAQSGAPAAPAVSSAQEAIDPAKLKAVQELYEVMNYHRTVKAMMEQASWATLRSIRPMAEARLKSDLGLSAAQRAKVQENLAKFDQKLPKLTMVLMDALSDPALVDELVAQSIPIYARNFTLPELEQLAAFYRTPFGARLLEVSPKLDVESMMASQQIITSRLEPMKQRFIEVLQQD